MRTFTSAALNWLTIILNERFGLDFSLQYAATGLKLSLTNASQGYILFPELNPVFHESRSDLLHTQWDAVKEGWSSALDQPLPAPGVSELPEQLIAQLGNHAVINYDILGLTYWMLNRLEEIGRTDHDSHGRFPATASHAYLHHYIERPVVDEWLHVLGQVIQSVWPGVSLKQHVFSMKVSHDVDAPSMFGFAKPRQFLRSMAVSLIKHKDVKSTIAAPWMRFNSKQRLHKADPYNTFDWIMDISDANNLTSAFYFICGRTSRLDADYEPEHPAIRGLMRRIHERGHEIGLHPSYGTFQKPRLIKSEANCLRKIMQKEGIQQERIGGRMHYLRWENPTTLQGWNDAGMSYDTTLSYADFPGFRCGTCFEYPAYNAVTQQLLKVRIRPLITMECTIIADRYMALGYGSEAKNKFIELKDKCRKVNGCFTLLWHNSHFTSLQDRRLYIDIHEA